MLNMGRRKWSPERMANVGAVMSVVQGGIGFGFCIFFLDVLLNEDREPDEARRVVLNKLTDGMKMLFVVMLFFAGILHFVWTSSGVYLLLGNRNGNARSLSQYVIVTTLICVMDIIFPFIVLPTTFNVFGVAMEWQRTQHSSWKDDEDPYLTDASDFGIYFWLLMVFIRGGCFTFAINSFSVYMAYQRFKDLHDLETIMEGNPGMREKAFTKELNDELNVRDSPTFKIHDEDENQKLNIPVRADDDEKLENQPRVYHDEPKGGESEPQANGNSPDP